MTESDTASSDTPETSILEHAKSLYFAQKYDDSRALLEDAAEAGFAEANFYIGVMCQMGLGYEENIERAAMNYQIASDSGHADAALNLGILNHAGLLGEGRLYIAKACYEQAAKLGHPQAEDKLLEVLDIIDPEKAGLRRVAKSREKQRSLWDRLTGRR